MVYSAGPMTRLVDWIQCRDRPLVMGILNVTPDSFFDGGKAATRSDAVDAALRMVAEGADLIDVGGESSRPGAEPISEQQEMDRVLPVVEAVRRRSGVELSVDTTKAGVASEAIALGATMVNDISAMRMDPDMKSVVAETGVFVVLMHMLGTPQTMQTGPAYRDVVEDVRRFLADRRTAAVAGGIRGDRILIDPGIGFGKRLEDNLALLRNLRRIAELGPPVVVGLSRKSFLGRILDLPASERLEATIAANTAAILRGAEIIRVHDVVEGRRTADIAYRLRNHED